MAEKIINTRVQLKYDTLTNWLASSVILKAGEVAIATIATTNDHSGLTPPAIGIKVGDGKNTFANLNWIQAVAGDVPTWAKEAAGATVKSWIDGAIGAIPAAPSGAGTTTFTSAKLIKSVTQDEGGKITNVTYEDITIDAVSGLTARLEGIDTAIGTKLDANLASTAATTANKLIDDNAAKGYADAAQSAAESTASSALSAAKTAILGEANYSGTVKGAYAEAKKANDAIAALDVTDSGTGVVTAISQTDGKIAYTKSAIDTVVAFSDGYNASSNKAATVKTVTDAVDAAKTELNNNLSQMTGAMRFRGTVTAAPTANTAAPEDGLGAWRAGDVVLFGTAEYVVSTMSSNKPVWQLLGDEGAYQTRLSFTGTPTSENKVVTNDTLEIAKTNLTAEIDKAKTAASTAQGAATAAQNTADSAVAEAQKANNAIAALDVADDTSKKGFVSAVTQTDGKIAVTKKEIGFADISDVAFEGTEAPSKTNKIITRDALDTVKTNIIDGINGSATATAVANNQVSVLTGVTLTAGKLTRSSEYKLAAVAATGKVADIDFSDTVLVLNCGSSTVNV